MIKALIGNKRNLILIVSGIVLVLIIAVVSVLSLGSGESKQPQPTQDALAANAEAAYITGTGVIEAQNQFDVVSTVTGKILSAPFEEGEQVKAGALLYKIDSADIQNTIEKTRLAVEKAQLAYDQTARNIRKLEIRPNISGTIQELYIAEGDMVMANSKIAKVVNNEVMILKVPFIEDTIKDIYEGQAASVTIVGSFYTVDGTVKKITSGRMVSADGSVVKIVEIAVNNPGTIEKENKGTAIVGSVACNDAGTFDYSSYETVIAEVSGKVESLSWSVGDHIKAGAVLVALKDDTQTSMQQQNSLGIKDAKLALENQNNQLQKYTIASPINGTVIKKNFKQGETLEMSNQKPLAVVADLSTIIFKMQVDELDISDVKVGQKVLITADAFADKEFTGSVDFISASGTQVSGVTQYAVTVVVDNPEGLLPGMNVNAKITID